MGRTVGTGSVEAGGVVMHRQPYHTMQRYPQWYTVDADLVLFGTPQDNVLMYDQARGHLLPRRVDAPTVRYALSPFVGERDCVNVVGDDPAAMVDAIVALSAAPLSRPKDAASIVAAVEDKEEAPPAVEAPKDDKVARPVRKKSAPRVEQSDGTLTYAVIGGLLLAAIAVAVSRMTGGRKSVKRRKTPRP
jgi:hypothetical protein